MPSSKKVSGSASRWMRSRAVSRPLECWFSMALAPPPSQIFCSSLRTCDIRSARKRILASKRADVGSTFVASSFAGADEFTTGSSLRSVMSRRGGLITVYQRARPAQRLLRTSRAALHPFRQSAAIFFQQERSYAIAFAKDAVRFWVAGGSSDPLLSNAVLCGGEPFLREHLHQTSL